MDINVLDEKLKMVDKLFDYVNYGGCCYVAAILAKQLRTVFPIMRITVSGYYGYSSIDKVRNNLDNPLDKMEWDNNGLLFRHVWVEVFVDDKWYALDATGVTPIEDMYENWGVPAEGSFTFEEVEALSISPDGWSSLFDRSQLPSIKFFIANELDEFIH